jgi:hypothetical protein
MVTSHSRNIVRVIAVSRAAAASTGNHRICTQRRVARLAAGADSNVASYQVSSRSRKQFIESSKRSIDKAIKLSSQVVSYHTN